LLAINYRLSITHLTVYGKLLAFVHEPHLNGLAGSAVGA
jgi:hypothetical protein